MDHLGSEIAVRRDLLLMCADTGAVVALSYAEGLPRNAMGKLDRPAIAARLAG